MSFVEKVNILSPYLGESTIGGFPVVPGYAQTNEAYSQPNLT